MPIEIRVGRVHDKPTPRDGTRVLVDRSWPAQVARADADVDGWIKQVAPSNGLRARFAHDPAKFEEFRRRYLVELESTGPRTALDDLTNSGHSGRITLLTSDEDPTHSHATILAEVLRHRLITHPSSDFAQITRWENEGGLVDEAPSTA